MKTRRPRRVIRGYRAFKQFTGYGETRTREMVADGTHPRAMKGARAASFFEDEIPVGSAIAPTEVAPTKANFEFPPASGAANHPSSTPHRGRCRDNVAFAMQATQLLAHLNKSRKKRNFWS
jgi:hypothetical protein